MDIDVAGTLALAVFGSYFLAILLLFTLILRSLPHAPLNTRAVWTFSLLTLASLTHTWFYMIKFLLWSFHTYTSSLLPTSPSSTPLLLPQIASWLTHTALFSQAWAAVSFGSFNWWWSEQLCLYTAGAWTLFLYTQARRYKIRRVWAYMLLGQLVAVSVASGVFYVAVVLARAREVGAKEKGLNEKKTGKERVPLTVTLPILLSLLTIIISPYTSTSNGTFLPNLLLMHFLLFVPLLSSPSPSLASSTHSTASTQNKYTKYTITTHTLTTTTTLTALTLRILAYKAAFASLPPLPSTTSTSNIHMFSAEAWRVLHDHPAQASIGWDVVWTGVGVGVWVLVGMRPVSRKESEGSTTRKAPTSEGPTMHKKSKPPTSRKMAIGKTLTKTPTSTSPLPSTKTSPSTSTEEEARTLYRKTLRLALLLTPFLSVGVTAPVVFERGRVLDGLAEVDGEGEVG